MAEPIHILLVDDEERNLDALEAILEDPAYTLLRASDADRALRALLENDVAAIVLDIQMPGVSGFELAKLIKGTKKTRQIPIVFLTAYLVEDKDIIAGYGAGGVDYLTKPVNPAILRHKVAVFAELFRKTRALAELNAHLESRVQERTAELEESERALRGASEQKDKFLATLAHELRNPLAPLRTGLDLLLHQPDAPTVTRTLAAMNRQLDHMVRLVDDLLDVARISRGTLELRKERADIRAVVDRAIEFANPAINRRKQSVVVEGGAPGAAMVDATRIAQVVANLLSNAAKHSPSGAKLRVQLESDPTTVTVRVIDEGVGIPHDQLGRVFDMFTKIERASSEPNDGLGIGLALSRQLADLHAGALTAASPGEGKGATFTLTLPRGDVVGAAPDADAASTRADSGALRVALVEDNEDAAEMMLVWLEQFGHEVHVARTGPAGLELVLRCKPDVVLCDLGLPGMDGVEVCRNVIAAMPDRPPVMIALTGWGMDHDRQRTVEAGFAHHLVKPIALDKLHELLQSVAKA